MLIVEKRELAEAICLFVIEAPLIAKKAQPGHFVIVRHKEKGERIPLTIADFDKEKGTITLVCQGIGLSTKEINQLQQGDSFIDILGPLGEPYPIKKLGKVLCVSGGLGVAPIYPKARALFEAGNEVVGIQGAQTRELLILTDKMQAICERYYLATDDGSVGHKGFVTDVVEQLLQQEKFDEVIAIGPIPMMSAVVNVTKKYNVPTIVSLNTLMVDGTGMCGGCRVTVAGETKFSCVDGPTFDGFEIDFKEILGRQAFYRNLESQAEHQCKIGGDFR